MLIFVIEIGIDALDTTMAGFLILKFLPDKRASNSLTGISSVALLDQISLSALHFVTQYTCVKTSWHVINKSFTQRQEASCTL